ncbi:hypothetical protein Pfo_007997 [Paulownia fortunei]|nr:hypothetical protein Pfo_007997 [Paulownia fortunei]
MFFFFLVISTLKNDVISVISTFKSNCVTLLKLKLIVSSNLKLEQNEPFILRIEGAYFFFSDLHQPENFKLNKGREKNKGKSQAVSSMLRPSNLVSKTRRKIKRCKK